MPPPPPPGPPAPPPPGPARASGPAFKPTKGGGDRGDLLKSIQKGAKLKKVETNDRSSPILGNNKNTNSGGGGGQGSRGVAQNQGGGGQEGGGAPGPLPGIGGLFAGGMPKLKSRAGGVQINRAAAPSPQQERGTPPNKWGQSSSNNLDKPFGSSSSSLNSSPSVSPSPSPTTHNISSSVKPNGAPPPPPGSKPAVPNTRPGVSPRGVTTGPVHPAMKPPPPPSPHGAPPSRASKSFSQHRPPATIGPGPKERTPLPMQPASRDDTSIQNGKIKPPPPPVRTVSRPPPLPPSNKRPSQPPPPPPSHSARIPMRDLPPPPPPNHVNPGGPPTPPTRKESIKPSGQAESFESRFSGKFRSMQYLPPPEVFSRCQKTYPSKNTDIVPVRQGSQMKRTQAPPPPPGKPPLPPGPPPSSRSWTSVS